MLKVAHFAVHAPHATGQYETVKELIRAERQVGIDAQFIDYGYDGKPECREGLVNGDITTLPLTWALGADIAIRHSVVPSEVYKKMPVLLALHGRPENSFRLEMLGILPVLSTVRESAFKKMHTAAFTFWEEHLFYWNKITGNREVHYVPPTVDLSLFDIYGEKYQFQDKGEINILIADMWREDETPFHLIFAATYFKEKFYPNAKLHLFGVPHKNKALAFLGSLQKEGVIGDVAGSVKIIDKIYRSADMVLTPNIIATRVMRESLASGVPILAPIGCKYTKYTAEPRDIEGFAQKMKDCYEETNLETRIKIREKAMACFNYTQAGNAMKKLCEGVLSGKISNCL